MAIKRKNEINPETSPFLHENEMTGNVSEATSMAEEKKETSKGKRSYWEFGLLVFLGLVLIAAVGFLVFLAVKKVGNPEKGKVSIQGISNSGSEAKEEMAQKVPVEKELEAPKVINHLEVAIKILNGGAVGGSAGKVKEVLVLKGYKKTEVGNSDKSNYVGVNVFYQAEMKAVAEKVALDLKTKYPTAIVKLGVSVEEKSGPIVIILGK